MDRVKISYRKYRKPGEKQKKDTFYMETSNKDKMREVFDMMLLVCCMNKQEKEEFKEWYKTIIDKR